LLCLYFYAQCLCDVCLDVSLIPSPLSSTSTAVDAHSPQAPGDVMPPPESCVPPLSFDDLRTDTPVTTCLQSQTYTEVDLPTGQFRLTEWFMNNS